MGRRKGMFPIFHHDAPIIISLPCCQVHIYDNFLLGMKFRSPLVFEIICIGTFDLWVYGLADIGLVHSGVESIAKVSVDNRVNNG